MFHLPSVNHIQKYLNNQRIFSATYFGGPKHVAENIVNEIHNKYGSVFVGYLYILDTLFLFGIIKLLIIGNQHNGMTNTKTKITVFLYVTRSCEAPAVEKCH
jgi:hypothetical protein